MGKSDFKKINDCWCNEENNRAALNKFYDEVEREKSSNRKKKTKIKVKKSNHKHEYKNVLLSYEDLSNISLGRQCTICNKIVCDKTFITEKTIDGYFRTLDDIEVLEHPKYKNLELIKAGKFFEKN